MSTGIMIIGPSGSGKTTLGKIVAQKLGYLYFDVDDYIWKQNTDSPYLCKEPTNFRLSDCKGRALRKVQEKDSARVKGEAP